MLFEFEKLHHLLEVLRGPCSQKDSLVVPVSSGHPLIRKPSQRPRGLSGAQLECPIACECARF